MICEIIIKYLAALLFLSTILVKNSNGANILGIFPTPSYSHQQPLLALSNALAAKGHNVTIVTTDPQKKNIKNLTEIDLSSMYEDWKNMQSSGITSLQTRQHAFEMISKSCSWPTLTTNAYFKKPEIHKFLREVNNTKYDLILYESIGYSSLLGVREMIGDPPVIGIVTLHTFPYADDPMGNPSLASILPSVFFGHNDRMTFWERMKNVLGDIYIRHALHSCVFPMHQEFINKFFPNSKRTAEELEFDKSLLIVSTDLATGYPKPVQPNTIYVGPMHLQEKRAELPQDLKKWMDEAEDGVVYFSLGSNMQGTSVPQYIRAAFIKAFKQLPKVRVLWKWESDEKMPGQPDNVLTRKWLPQKSVFAHPKLKVFISQVGLQSFQEAIENAIPILGIPMFGDQDFNAKKLVTSGAGLRLEFSEITYEEVYEKLKSLLTDPSYKKNMQRLSSITTDKPMSAIETAVWWCEYVIRHNGAPHLRPASLDLPWYQYYMLDILSFVILLLSIVLYLIFFIVKRLLRLLYSFNSIKNIKVKKS